jgi:hypothetical protein
MLFAMSDASFVRGGDSKSQLSYSLFLATDAGSFYNTKSQKDNESVSLSSFHSEMNSLVDTIMTVIIYYRDLLEELGYKQSDPSNSYLF